MAYRELMLKDFYKGVNLSRYVDLPDASEVLIGRNIVINPGEGYTMRPGLKSAYTNDDIPWSKLFTVVWEPKGRGYIIFTGSNIFFLSNDMETLIALSENIEYREDLNMFSPAVMSNKMYVVTGVKFYSWDLDLEHQFTEVTPKSEVNIDHIKKCTILLVRNNFMYGTGSNDEPSLVYFSALGDPTDFPVTNAIKAVTNDGDKITSLVEFLDKLMAMKYYSAYGGSGAIPTTELVWYKMIVHEGTVSPWAYARVQNSLAIMGRNGIYLIGAVYTDVYSTTNVSNRLNDFISSLKNKDKVKLVHYQNRLYSIVDSDGDGLNDTILVGHNNLIHRETSQDEKDTSAQLPFTVWDAEGLYPSQLLGNLNDDLLVFHKVGEYIHISIFDRDLYRDEFNESAIPVHVKHRIDFGKPLNNKVITSVILFVKQNMTEDTTLRYRYKFDFVESPWVVVTGGEQSGVWDNSLWDKAKWGWIDAVPVELSIRRRGYVLDIEIEHSVIDEPFTLYGMGFKYKLKKIKGVKNR